MKKFNLSGIVTISVNTIVEAETLEEAIEIASEREIKKYNCDEPNQIQEVWISNEYDGEVCEIKEE